MLARTINISSSTIIRAILIVLAFIFIYYIADVLFLIFFSFVIVSAISPFVDKLEKKKVPRVVSTIFIYGCVIIGFGYLISLVLPHIIYQTRQLFEHLPNYWNSIATNSWLNKSFGIKDLLNSANQGLLNVLGENISFPVKILSQAGSFFIGFIYFAVIFSLSFYMTIQKDALKRLVKTLIPKKHKKYAYSLVTRIQEKMGRWLQGQLILNVIIGGMVYLVLFIIGVPFALVLALIAGILEFIPTIGPTIATIIAVLVALTISPLTAILVVVSFIVIQQLENHFIVPLVMKKAVGLSPVIIIIVILMGVKIAGPIGAIIAVPAATALSVFIGDLFDKSSADMKSGEKAVQ